MKDMKKTRISALLLIGMVLLVGTLDEKLTAVGHEG
jgi:hypothetical protein